MSGVPGPAQVVDLDEVAVRKLADRVGALCVELNRLQHLYDEFEGRAGVLLGEPERPELRLVGEAA